MAILKPKRGSGIPSGLQQNELAIDVLNKRIYLGNNGGTGDIVSSHITDYVTNLNSATGAVNIYAGSGLSVATSTSIRGITFTNTGVLSIDSATGAITNVARTNTAQTFTGLQNFSNGISAAGGTFTALTRFNSGITCTGITLGGNLNISGTSRYIYHDGLIIQGNAGGVHHFGFPGHVPAELLCTKKNAGRGLEIRIAPKYLGGVNRNNDINTYIQGEKKVSMIIKLA